MRTKTLPCKHCGVVIEVPDVRLSAVCEACAEALMEKSDAEEEIEETEELISKLDKNCEMYQSACRQLERAKIRLGLAKTQLKLMDIC